MSLKPKQATVLCYRTVHKLDFGIGKGWFVLESADVIDERRAKTRFELGSQWQKDRRVRAAKRSVVHTSTFQPDQIHVSRALPSSPILIPHPPQDRHSPSPSAPGSHEACEIPLDLRLQDQLVDFTRLKRSREVLHFQPITRSSPIASDLSPLERSEAVFTLAAGIDALPIAERTHEFDRLLTELEDHEINGEDLDVRASRKRQKIETASSGPNESALINAITKLPSKRQADRWIRTARLLAPDERAVKRNSLDSTFRPLLLTGLQIDGRLIEMEYSELLARTMISAHNILAILNDMTSHVDVLSDAKQRKAALADGIARLSKTDDEKIARMAKFLTASLHSIDYEGKLAIRRQVAELLRHQSKEFDDDASEFDLSPRRRSRLREDDLFSRMTASLRNALDDRHLTA